MTTIETNAANGTVLLRLTGPHLDPYTPTAMLIAGSCGRNNCFDLPLTEDELDVLAAHFLGGVRQVQRERELKKCEPFISAGLADTVADVLAAHAAIETEVE